MLLFRGSDWGRGSGAAGHGLHGGGVVAFVRSHMRLDGAVLRQAGGVGFGELDFVGRGLTVRTAPPAA